MVQWLKEIKFPFFRCSVSTEYAIILITSGRKSSNLVKSHELISHFIRLYLVPLLPYSEVFFALKWIRNLGEVASQREAAWKTQWVLIFFFLIFQPLGLVLLETFLDFFSYIQYCIDIFCLLDSSDHFSILKPPFSRNLFVYVFKLIFNLVWLGDCSFKKKNWTK